MVPWRRLRPHLRKKATDAPDCLSTPPAAVYPSMVTILHASRHCQSCQTISSNHCTNNGRLPIGNSCCQTHNRQSSHTCLQQARRNDESCQDWCLQPLRYFATSSCSCICPKTLLQDILPLAHSMMPSTAASNPNKTNCIAWDNAACDSTGALYKNESFR